MSLASIIGSPGKNVYYFFTCSLLFIVLLVLVIGSPAKLIYDENYYIPAAKYLLGVDSLKTFARDWPIGPGPLHALIHSLLKPLTNLEPPSIRFINIGFLLATICFLFGLSIQLGSKQPFLASISVLGLPTTMVISGMALTEMPAICFFTAGQYLLISALRVQGGYRRVIALIIGGLFAGISIVGRQPYLLALLPLPLLCVGHIRNRWWQLTIFLLAAIIFPGVLFLVWGGLLPPSHAFVAKKLFSIQHAIISLAYAGTLTLILAPKWFQFNRRYLYILPLATIFIFFASSVRLAPLSTLAQHYLNDRLFEIYTILSSLVLMSIALFFLISLCDHALKKKQDSVYLYFSFCLILLVISSGFATHLFSSRFTAMAIPLIVLVADRFIDTGLFGSLRMVFGGVIGLLSLLSYYYG